jgi:hypothetical protein
VEYHRALQAGGADKTRTLHCAHGQIQAGA